MMSESIDCQKLQADIDELQKKRDILQGQITEADENGVEELSRRDFMKLANEAEETSERLLEEYAQDFYDMFPETHCKMTLFCGSDGKVEAAALPDGNLVTSDEFGFTIMSPIPGGDKFGVPSDENDNDAYPVVMASPDDDMVGSVVAVLPDGSFVTVEKEKPRPNVPPAASQTINIYRREVKGDGDFRYVGKKITREFTQIKSVRAINDDAFIINTSHEAKIVNSHYENLLKDPDAYIIKSAAPLPNGGMLAIINAEEDHYSLNYFIPDNNGRYVQENIVGHAATIETVLPNGDIIVDWKGNLHSIRMKDGKPIFDEKPIESFIYQGEADEKEYISLPNGNLVIGNKTSGYSLYKRSEEGYQKCGDDSFTQYLDSFVAANEDNTIIMGVRNAGEYEYYLYEPGGESGYVRGDKIPLLKTKKRLVAQAVSGDGRLIVSDERGLSTLRVWSKPNAEYVKSNIDKFLSESEI